MDWRRLLIEKRAEKMLPPKDFRPDIFGDIVEKYKSEVERGWRILMVGIIVEVIAALGISVISGLEVASLNDKAEQAGKDAANAERDAGQANERAANTDSNNLVLRSNVVALEIKLQPRNITTKQIEDFMFLTDKMSKFPIRVRIGSIDSAGFARRVRFMLNQAGYTTPDEDSKFSEGVNFETTGYVFPKTNRDNVEWDDVVFCTDSTNEVESYHFRFEITNGFTRPIVYLDGVQGDTNRIFAALDFVFGQIGIKTGQWPKSDLAGSAHFGIFVNPKSQ
jgi:hypothetical protein